MTPDEILKIDAKRNHQDTTAQDLVDIINQEIKVGAYVVREGETLILFKSTKKDRAEFHCFNADSAANLVKNVIGFFTLLRKLGYTYAETPYDNPRVSELIQQTVPAGRVRIEPTPDGRYLAEVTL